MTGDAELLALALSIATEAGSLVEEMRRLGGAEVSGTKSSPTDIVTAADTAAEELIRTRLLEVRPGDGLLGEEGTVMRASTGVRWIVDPIDGTVNYLYGRAAYAVSIAVEREGRMVAGVVHQPAAGLTWTARAGGGAFLNGAPISPSTCGDVSQALVATGFGYGEERRRQQAHVLARILPRVRDIRRDGAASLDLCAVACGRADAYYEEGLNLWDHAAGGLVAVEAGAWVGGPGAGPPSGSLVAAAAPGIAASWRAVLDEFPWSEGG